MERIHYSNDTFLTGNDIATAVFAYSEALAKRASCASVTIPVRDANGSIQQARLLLGPASQLVSQSEANDFDELIDKDLVAFIRHEIELLKDVQAGSAQPADLDPEYQWDL